MTGFGALTGFDVRADTEGVLWVSGEIDMSVSERFEAAAAESLDGQREFVIDLSGVSFLDSTGIRAILSTAKRTDKGVCLREPRPSVRKVIELTGIIGRNGIRIEDAR